MSTTNATPEHLRRWWNADKEKVHKLVFEAVQKIESAQFDLFDRFVKLEAMYDPNSPWSDRIAEQMGLVTENVIKSNVDTVAAVVAATDVRSRFQTDGGDWSTQRTAQHLEWYSEGMATLLDRHKQCHRAFRESAKKGTGCVAVYVDRFDQIRVEHVLVDDVVVPISECKNGQSPRQMHRRMIVDREELRAEYPDHGVEIDKAQQSGRWAKWADYRPIEPGEIIKIESWRLPIGIHGMKGYIPGRHTVTIDGCDLLDEKWHKPHFPIWPIRWTERSSSWYGISLAEGIAGHQRNLNKMNWQTDRNLDQIAVPTTYVSAVDVNATVKPNRAGNFCVIRGEKPTTVIPQAVSGEVWKRMADLKASAYEDSGVSRMAASAAKPAGIDSGVALREYRDQTTQRFAPQEKAFEELNQIVDWAILECCKDLGAKAPKIYNMGPKFDQRRINWAKLDLVTLKISMAPASTLSRTPAGRAQFVLELAQAGIISTDETRRLMEHPDIEEAMSLATAALEAAEYDFEQIADGKIVMPEPFANLKMCEVRGQQKYLRWSTEGAPEAILESLRQYIVQSVATQKMLAPPVANDSAAGAAPGVMPDASAAAGMPPFAANDNGAPPNAALSAQAMQLRAV